MIKIKIPLNDREIVDGKIKNNPGEIVAHLDMTVFAEERWQKHFPENAKNETLFAYVERMQKQNKISKKDMVTIISNLKALYCFLKSDELPTFKTFAQLFDLSDQVTLDKQVKVIREAFDIILHSSAISQKN
jgi:hypothetical protein|nr:MAG TPA: hypothetical protein [Caudoviricetes sp.]